jgi:hypothetical protein
MPLLANEKCTGGERLEQLARSRRLNRLCYNRAMPTVLRSGPFRFYFYSHEPNEPPHVHVDRDDASAKFWLDTVQLAANFGFRAHELREIQDGNRKSVPVIGGLG